MNTATTLFFEKFAVLAASPRGIPKLRELILQLAVQGKLVPQDPKDEPASELLKKIQAERAKLIKEGKLKKQKPLLIIEKNETPFVLPGNWEWVKLGTLTFFEYGKGLSKEKRKSKAKYPVYGANGVMCYCDTPYIKGKSLIIGRKGSAGAVNISETSSWPTDVTYYVQPLDQLCFGFIYLLLKSLHLEEMGKGIKPGLNRNEAHNRIVAVPPLAEQKRIVAKVDQLMALCDTLEQQVGQVRQRHLELNASAIHHLLSAEDIKEFEKVWRLICDNFDLLYDSSENVDKLRQAILQLAVQGKLVPQDPKDEPASELLKKIQAEKARLIKEGKLKKEKPLLPIKKDEIPFAIPNGWKWVQLGEITSKIGSGSTPLGGKSVYVKEGVKFLRSQNVYNDGLRLDNVVYVKRAIHEKMSNTSVFPGDILLNITGASIARSCLVPDDFDEGNVSQHVSIVRPVIKEIRRYLHACIISPYVFNMIMNVQVGISREGLSKGRMQDFLIPLPPLNEQKRIVAKVDQLMALCDQLEEKINKSRQQSEKLTESIIHHFLAG